MISGGCLGDIRGINEEIHVSGIWEIYGVISAWVVQPRGPLDHSNTFVTLCPRLIVATQISSDEHFV